MNTSKKIVLNATDTAEQMCQTLLLIDENMLSKLAIKYNHKNYQYYSEDGTIILTDAVHTLARNIQSLLKKDPSLQTDAKRLLHATYRAITCPTYDNLNELFRISQEVEGQGNEWAQTAMVVTSIMGLIMGLVPGLILIVIFFGHVIDDKGNQRTLSLWEQNTRRGIAKEADKIDLALEKKHTNNFFFGKKDFSKNDIINLENKILSAPTL